MTNDITDAQRIEMAMRIYDEAEDLAGSEVADGMRRALDAADAESIAVLEAEFFPLAEN